MDDDGPVTHELKTLSAFFDDVKSGIKTFEARRNDRGFSVGDKLWLRRYDPPDNEYDGQELHVTVVYILRGPGFGIKRGYVVMGIQKEKNG